MEPAQGDQWPEARNSHSACCLNTGEDHPMVLVSGGVNKDVKILGDMWILDVDSGKWTEVRMLVYSNYISFSVTLDLELIHIVCTNEVFVYYWYLHNHPMHGRSQLCLLLFFNYCMGGGDIRV